MSRRGALVLALLAALVGLVLVGYLALRQPTVQSADPATTQATPARTQPTKPKPTRASRTPMPGTGSSGLTTCSVGTLPSQVADAVRSIRNDGPYLRPSADGDVFGNRERLLPSRPSGFYREYTVAAPGVRFPGPRRIVTGGQSRPGADVEIWFYTADHYESFCEMLN